MPVPVFVRVRGRVAEGTNTKAPPVKAAVAMEAALAHLGNGISTKSEKKKMDSHN
jgi:hypothetical protein